MNKVPEAKRVYIDESGMYGNESAIKAWGRIGTIILNYVSGNRNGRTSMIGALIQNKIIAPFMFQGACNRTIFETYLEKVLLPNLEEGSVLIMDNAAFHKGGKIAQLVEKYKCSILYLPKYSPDLNPIENFWFVLKNKVRNLVAVTKKKVEKCVELAFRALSRLK